MPFVKRSFFVLCFFLVLVNAKAQQMAHFSQYFAIPEIYNPATITADYKFNAVGLFRQQWVGVENAPQSLFFAVSAPFQLFKQSHGVGIMFTNDTYGVYATQSVFLQYAFKYRIKENTLSFGLNVGFLNHTIDGEKVSLITSDYHTETDPIISTSKINAMAFDLAVGAAWKAKKYHVGVSFLRLTKPEFDLDDNIKTSFSQFLCFTGGYTYQLPQKRYELRGEGLVKTDFKSFQFNIDALFTIDQRYYLGLGWRFQDAVVFMAGFYLPFGLNLGYSYDLATTKLFNYSSGSHEVYLRYSFLFGKKKQNSYKSVRIL